MTRTRRTNRISHITLEQLANARDAAIEIRKTVKINSENYKLAGEIITAIDQLTVNATGQSAMRSLKPHSTVSASR